MFEYRLVFLFFFFSYETYDSANKKSGGFNFIFTFRRKLNVYEKKIIINENLCLTPADGCLHDTRHYRLNHK